MNSDSIKSMKFEDDGIFQITNKTNKRKCLVYNKDDVKHFPCPLNSFVMYTCNKAVATEDMKVFCMDPKFTGLFENMSEEDSDKLKKLTGKKLEKFIFSQMKEHKVYCLDTGSEK